MHLDVRGALQYPAAVIGVMAVAILVLQQFVVPQFSKSFAQLGADLPLPTRILIGSTNFFQNYWWVLLIGIAGGGWFLRRTLATDSGRLYFHRVLLKIPLLGTILTRMYLARFARTFGLLQGQGLPILGALQVVKDTIGNDQISREVDDMAELVLRGQSLADAVVRQPSFTPMVRNMISVGEKSGQLDDTMKTISDFYDSEIRAAIRDLTQWIEPALTLVLGAFVLFLALAIFLPWWDMTGLYRK